MNSAPREALVENAALVSELLQTMVKAQRAFGMYLPNNPIYHRAADNIRAAFAPVWQAIDELVLMVDETDFRWEEQAVYQQPSKQDSLAWVLYKDGMRVLTLRRGVEEAEIVRFLETINKARRLSPDASDDLLTLLWEQEFGHIAYRFIEGFGEGSLPEAEGVGMGGTASTSPQETQRAVREEAPPKPSIVDLEDFDSTLYFLDEAEVTYIQQELRKEYERDLRDSALNGLYDTFERETTPEVRDEILGIVEPLFPSLISQSEFRAVAGILREMRTLERAAQLTPAHTERLRSFEKRLSEADIVRQLVLGLDEAPHLPADEDVAAVLRELRPSALGVIVAALPGVQNPRARALLEAAVDRMASANANEVLRLLRDPNTEALSDLIGICGRLKLQGAVQGLSETLAHTDPAVRLATVQALTEIGTPGTLAAMEKVIDDNDRGVRLAAVRALGARGYKNALRRIEPVVMGKADRAVDLTERMAFFEAFGAIAGAGGIPPLSSMLLSKGVFGFRANPETRACAAVALGRIRTPEARAVLQQAMEDKELVVRNAVSRALRGGDA